MLTYSEFLTRQIDLSPLGLERRKENITYFCTPKGAEILGWAGVDGIHYCRIPDFGEMIFAVSPMNSGAYVRPIARSFADLLGLLLACVDMAALEQCYAWEEEQFKAFLLDNPATPEQQAVLSAIRDAFGLAPMADAFGYVKRLQGEFDLRKIPYTQEYYEVVEDTPPQGPPEWKVYFGGGFWGSTGDGSRPGKEIPVNKAFQWADRSWLVPAVYACGQGLVVDFCMRIEPWLIEAFMEKWNLYDEEAARARLTREEEMELERENPLDFDFRAQVWVNGRRLQMSRGSGVTYNPCLPPQYEIGAEAAQAVEHYGLDPRFGWMIRRSCFPWATKRRPALKTLSLTLGQEKAAVPGPRFRVKAPGDRVSFRYPEKGPKYTLTVQEYEAQTLKPGHLGETMDIPTQYHVMTYTLTPELPGDALTILDCAQADNPRPKPGASATHAASIGIIGGADGPTAILFGGSSAKLHAACSSLHFDPVEDVQWRMVFYEKRYADLAVSLI